jgi:hypothetical protein
MRCINEVQKYGILGRPKRENGTCSKIATGNGTLKTIDLQKERQRGLLLYI